MGHVARCPQKMAGPRARLSLRRLGWKNGGFLAPVVGLVGLVQR